MIDNQWLMRSRTARLVALFAFACLGPGALAAQQATVIHNVNLRPTPSTDQPSLRLLTPPEVVTLLEAAQQNGYYHVRTGQNEEGWLWGRNVAVDSTAVPAPDTSGAVTGGHEAIDDPACPAVGSHVVGGVKTPYGETTDAGLRNMAKRHVPGDGAPVPVDLFVFHALQDVINSRFADAHATKTAFQPDRSALTHLPTSAGSIGEGSLVRFAGYLLAVHGEGPESVNCGGDDGNDIHLSLGDAGATEWQGIVAEMIPQLGHPTGWDVATLGKVHNAGLQVLVIGGLTYDNEHFVNDDPAHNRNGQPKRISLWEIHPITRFYVCPTGTCNPADSAQWQSLTTWAANH